MIYFLVIMHNVLYYILDGVHGLSLHNPLTPLNYTQRNISTYETDNT